MLEKAWESHYLRDKSVLIYPDENLVRMIKAYIAGMTIQDVGKIKIIDIGCGTGRHLKLLDELGFEDIAGLDFSLNALNICRDYYNCSLVQAENSRLPFKDNSFDIAISWGSLHYCDKKFFKIQLKDIHRIMNEDAVLFGTLRSERDTYLKKGKHLGNDIWVTDLDDIKNSVVSFFSEEELKSYFGIFKKLEFGLMERSIIGDTKKIISHWFFRAIK